MQLCALVCFVRSPATKSDFSPMSRQNLRSISKNKLYATVNNSGSVNYHIDHQMTPGESPKAILRTFEKNLFLSQNVHLKSNSWHCAPPPTFGLASPLVDKFQHPCITFIGKLKTEVSTNLISKANLKISCNYNKMFWFQGVLDFKNMSENITSQIKLFRVLDVVKNFQLVLYSTNIGKILHRPLQWCAHFYHHSYEESVIRNIICNYSVKWYILLQK